MTLTGSSGGSNATNASGNYSFSGLTSGGSYTVTPSKADLSPGSIGIDTVDVIAIQRQFIGLGTPLSGCRLLAADVVHDLPQAHVKAQADVVVGVHGNYELGLKASDGD